LVHHRQVSPIVQLVTRIQDNDLRVADPELHSHMKALDITPQVYGMYVYGYGAGPCLAFEGKACTVARSHLSETVLWHHYGAMAGGGYVYQDAFISEAVLWHHYGAMAGGGYVTSLWRNGRWRLCLSGWLLRHGPNALACECMAVPGLNAVLLSSRLGAPRETPVQMRCVADARRRWIRLLFGREMGLDDLLVLWDVMFADSPQLKLAEYVAVAMLLAIRDRRMCAQMRMHIDNGSQQGTSAQEPHVATPETGVLRCSVSAGRASQLPPIFSICHAPHHGHGPG
jgi:hypothetical protein